MVLILKFSIVNEKNNDKTKTIEKRNKLVPKLHAAAPFNTLHVDARTTLTKLLLGAFILIESRWAVFIINEGELCYYLYGMAYQSICL